MSRGLEVLDMVGKNSEIGCGVQMMLRWYKRAQSQPIKYPHFITSPAAL